MTIVSLHGRNFLHVADRTELKSIASAVATGLREGDTAGVRAALDSMPELDALGTRNAILGAPDPTIPWSRTPSTEQGVRAGSSSPNSGYEPVEAFGHELAARGARPIHVSDAGMVLRKLRNEPPRGVATDIVDDPYEIQALLDAGVTVVNPYPIMRNSKAIMGDVWQELGISTPATRTGLSSDDAVAAAYADLGRDVVLKRPISAQGIDVHEAHDLDEAIRLGRRLRHNRSGSVPLMQRMVDIGGTDLRVHFGRDWRTGDLHVIGAVERASLGADFRTNLSVGGAVRPIYDLTGGDVMLSRAAIDEARRAGDALGLDWFSADVALERGTRRPVLFEVDVVPTPLELHFPVPRQHQTFLHLADLVLHGSNATMQAARGRSLLAA